MTLHINLLTLFPEMFPGSLGHSLAGKALEEKKWSYTPIQIRDFAQGKHQCVDDTPYGGGAGMVMRADVIEKALLSILQPGRKIYLSPRGRPLTQSLVKELSAEKTLTLLCGRYEGVDQRVLDAHDFEEISVGDYVLSGGEVAALNMMDACIRLLPGVMGNAETPDQESFGAATGGLLEYPHYTRPGTWNSANGRAYDVPEILKTGDHGKIDAWRRDQSRAITQARRPDLISSQSQEDTKTPRKNSVELEKAAKIIVDCAFHVHKELGPGLLESIYEHYFIEKLVKAGLRVQKQVPIPLKIGDFSAEIGFRADIIVENQILIELKAVEQMLNVHKAQTISYLKLGKFPLGFLINFNTDLIKNGIRRFAN